MRRSSRCPGASPTYEEIIALPRRIADARLTEDHSIPGYREARGRPDEAQIMAGRVHAVNTHRWRRIPGGKVVEFLD